MNRIARRGASIVCSRRQLSRQSLPVPTRFFAAAPQAGRGAALAAALRQIESSFGKGSVMQLGKGPIISVPVIRTGSLTLDHALGVGGLPKGRVVEIFGPESSGKTTLALHVIAEAQKDGGVDLDSLYLSQPDSGEQALEIADTLVRSGGVDVVVIDSVAALVPKAELEGDMGDAHIALQARLMSQALRKLTSSLSKSNTLIIFINQIRSKVGVMFGSPDVTSGGNALKFYASIRMEIRRIGQVKKGEEVVGNETRVKIVKNKLAPPFRSAEFEMTFGMGINRAAEAVDMAVTWGVLKRSGAWYSVADPLLLAAVNAALQAERAAPPSSSAVAAPAPAVPLEKPSARKKGGRAAKSAAVTEDAAGSADATQLDLTPGGDGLAAASGEGGEAPAVIALGEAFLQGREKMKAFFLGHPSVLQAAVRSVKLAMKAAPAQAAPPPAAATPAAAALPHEASVSDDEDFLAAPGAISAF